MPCRCHAGEMSLLIKEYLLYGEMYCIDDVTRKFQIPFPPLLSMVGPKTRSKHIGNENVHRTSTPTKHHRCPADSTTNWVTTACYRCVGRHLANECRFQSCVQLLHKERPHSGCVGANFVRWNTEKAQTSES